MNHQPYVYKCSNSVTGQYYFGYRCANKVPAHDDLGKVYKTSSKIVKANFDQFTFEVIRECNTPEEAYNFEQKLIHDAMGDPLLLNRACHYQKKPFYSMDPETRRKIGLKSVGRDNGRRGKPKSDEERAKLSASTKRIVSDPNYVNPSTLQHVKDKISEWKTEWWKTAPLITCPHCGSSSKNKGNMTRHHFNNCKSKPV